MSVSPSQFYAHLAHTGAFVNRVLIAYWDDVIIHGSSAMVTWKKWFCTPIELRIYVMETPSWATSQVLFRFLLTG